VSHSSLWRALYNRSMAVNRGFPPRCLQSTSL
jgi:hypothetical protein